MSPEGALLCVLFLLLPKQPLNFDKSADKGFPTLLPPVAVATFLQTEDLPGTPAGFPAVFSLRLLWRRLPVGACARYLLAPVVTLVRKSATFIRNDATASC